MLKIVKVVKDKKAPEGLVLTGKGAILEHLAKWGARMCKEHSIDPRSEVMQALQSREWQDSFWSCLAARGAHLPARTGGRAREEAEFAARCEQRGTGKAWQDSFWSCLAARGANLPTRTRGRAREEAELAARCGQRGKGKAYVL